MRTLEKSETLSAVSSIAAQSPSAQLTAESTALWETNAPAVIYVGYVGNLREYLVAEGATNTVESVCRAMDIDTSGYQIRVNGEPAALNSPVQVGQSIMLLRAIRGNSGAETNMETNSEHLPDETIDNADACQPFFVSVGFVGNIQERMFPGGRTYNVAEVLKRSEISSNGYEVRIDGLPGSLETNLTSGQTVMLLRPIRGN